MKALEVAASWAFFLLLGQGPVIIGFDGCFLLIYLQKSGFDYFWGTEVQEILYFQALKKADDGNWTRDPFLTKEVLYLWATSTSCRIYRSHLDMLPELNRIVNPYFLTFLFL